MGLCVRSVRLIKAVLVVFKLKRVHLRKDWQIISHSVLNSYNKYLDILTNMKGIS